MTCLRVNVLRAVSVVAGVAVVLGILEIALRFVAPQNLSGTWTQVDKRGLAINKAGGTAVHQTATRTVTYRFNDVYLRGGPLRARRRAGAPTRGLVYVGGLLDEKDTYVARLVVAVLNTDDIGRSLRSGLYEFSDIRSLTLRDRPGGAEPVLFGHAVFRRMKAWCAMNNSRLLVATTGWHIRL